MLKTSFYLEVYMSFETIAGFICFDHFLSPLGESLIRHCQKFFIPFSIRDIEQGNDIEKMRILMHNKASDEIAIVENCQKSHIQITVDAKGFIRIFQRVSTPLTAYQKKINVLATLSLELTPYMNLLNLLQIYKKYYIRYTNEVEAFQKFSSYLNLGRYFSEALSNIEITILAAMICDSRQQQIVELISAFDQKKRSLKIISTQLQFLKGKLKSNFDIQMVLNDLKRHHQIEHFDRCSDQ